MRRQNNNHKKGEENNGYGLTGVKEVVEKYNGTIEIKPDDTILLSWSFSMLTEYEL